MVRIILILQVPPTGRNSEKKLGSGNDLICIYTCNLISKNPSSGSGFLYICPLKIQVLHTVIPVRRFSEIKGICATLKFLLKTEIRSKNCIDSKTDISHEPGIFTQRYYNTHYRQGSREMVVTQQYHF